jgi:hypothetical protein
MDLKMGERQSCEQLVDVDEPHAELMNPTSNSMTNSEPHAEVRQSLITQEPSHKTIYWITRQMSEMASQYANPGGVEHMWEQNVLHNFLPP